MPISTEAIGLVGVSKAYPGVNALSDVSFSVTKGRVHGFLGPNGAGKSTTMNIITGLLKESSGHIRIMGEETALAKRKTLIGYLPEIPPIYPQMRVGEYLKFVANIYGAKDLTLVDKAIESCGLGSVKERMIGNLSKGFKQRVGLAQTLVFGAKIIILDEPTVGLDPVSVGEIRNLIKNLAGDHTVLLSSHLLHEVSLLCDDITMINHGKLVASGTLKEIEDRFAGGARYRVCAKNIDGNMASKLKQDFAIEVKQEQTSWILQSSKTQTPQQVLEMLVSAGAGVSEFYQEKTELEDIFKIAMEQGAQG